MFSFAVHVTYSARELRIINFKKNLVMDKCVQKLERGNRVCYVRRRRKKSIHKRE
jgi:hypothetical protein